MDTLSYWTCRKIHSGTACLRVNPNRFRKCRECGAAKPARRVPKHLAALEVPYADYVKLNGGEFCAICGRDPSDNRRLDRDHDHRTGRPRGLLCHRCNRALPNWADIAWLRAATVYLERAV